MRILAPVTDYVRASLLTTQGDLVKHNGSVAARFPMAGAMRVLRVNPGGTDLEYVYPGRFLFESEFSAKNVSTITLNAAWTTIVNIDLGTLQENGRYSVIGHIKPFKVGTGSKSNISVGKESGTAVVSFLHDSLNPEFNQFSKDSHWWTVSFNFIMKVITTGTLVLRIAGTVDADTATVAIGEGQLYVHRMKIA